MVSGGTVSGDASSLSNVLGEYLSDIEGLSSTWKGPSYDNIQTKASNFVSEYKGLIVGQMESFANACNLYLEYVTCKQNLEISKSNYNQAVSNQDSAAMSTYSNSISNYTSRLNTLKSEIQSALASASSVSLQATAINANVTAEAESPSTSGGGENPNYIYSAKYPGYVFPFEKGVNAPVTSHVGRRTAPTEGASTNHQGTDIGAANGTEIHAIYSGKVVTSGSFGGYGNCVRIQQDDGNLTYYGHCSKTTVQVGERVEAGDVVGNVGSTGVSTGPHLHLEIRAADYDSTKNLIDSEDIFEGVWPEKV